MEITPQNEQMVRQGFKAFNRFMLLWWRLGMGGVGNGTPWGGAFMIITHVGRKSGRSYQTPVNYALHGDDVYCTAGFGRAADWYRNLMQTGTGEIWLPDGRWQVTAEDVSGGPDRAARLRDVLTASGFAGPLFGVDPSQMSDADLEALLESYRLVRLRRTAPLPGAPADLLWVWPALTMGLVFLLLGRRRR
jgi:deazaflavin-dependent oxidoreductase (nitroreductase family)